MARPRLSVRKVKEILRLKYESRLSERAIATACKVSRSTVADYLARASEAGLTWPLPVNLSEAELEAMLFPSRVAPIRSDRPMPDWKEVHLELRRKGVTLWLLWEEYIEQYPNGYSYSRFCELYAEWKKPLNVRMRQVHVAGEKLFVDYSGLTATVIDPETGEERTAEIFVAVLGASNYTYVEATWSQSLPDWIGAHTNAFSFLGGVPRVVVPDNIKSGVTKANYYEPELNRTYAEMARHYGVAVLPTRTNAPRDKAKAEKGVQDIQRRILAPLRNRRFFSLGELNEAIDERLDPFNSRPMQLLDETRQSLFEKLDRPKLRPLPRHRYTYAEWKKATPGIDYHVKIDYHFYSVPYTLAHRELDVRVTATTIECFYKEERVAAHGRSYVRGGHTTLKAHMPEGHRKYAEWTPERFINWAAKTGPATAEMTRRIMAERQYPEQGFRACRGLMRLSQKHGPERTEAACRRALASGAIRFRSVESILKKGLDKLELPDYGPQSGPIKHANIRGPRYYN